MKKYLLSCLLCFFTLVPFYGQRVLFPTPSSYSQDKGNCNIGRLANVSGTGNEAIQLAESRITASSIISNGRRNYPIRFG